MSNYITEIVKDSVTYNIKDTANDNKLDKNNAVGSGKLLINGTATGTNSVSLGLDCVVSGNYSYAEGYNNSVSGDYSHVEGDYNNVTASYSHIEGKHGIKQGTLLHVEGKSHVTNTSTNCHLEGDHSQIELAGSSNCHLEGYYTEIDAISTNSHLEGGLSRINKVNAAHAEGGGTYVSANYGHAEGQACGANTDTAIAGHAEGYYTSSRAEAQHSQGMYSVSNSAGTYIDIVGYGDEEQDERVNVSALTTTGTLRIKGNIYINCNDDSTGGQKITKNHAKLVAKEGTTIVINRDGLVETHVGEYNKDSNPMGIVLRTGTPSFYRGSPKNTRVLSAPNSKTSYNSNKVGYINGIDFETPISQLSNLVEVVNGGTFELYSKEGKKLSLSSNSYIGTGMIIKVFSEEGCITEEFVVFIWGDLNGDGMLDYDDIKLMDDYIKEKASDPSMLSPYTAVFFYAADLDSLDNINVTDAASLSSLYRGTIVRYQTNMGGYTVSKKARVVPEEDTTLMVERGKVVETYNIDIDRTNGVYGVKEYSYQTLTRNFTYTSNSNWFIYGLDINSSVADLSSALIMKDDTLGSYTIYRANGTVASSSDMLCTGMYVQVFDTNNNLVEKLTYIVFGDISGDGNVEASDSLLVLDYIAGTRELTPAQIKAADLNQDGFVTSQDAQYIVDYEQMSGNIDQRTGRYTAY